MVDSKCKNRVLVIVPMYNESENVEFVLNDLSEVDYDVIMIDDKSVDDTAKSLRLRDADVLHLPINLGIGGCIQAGYKYALENDYDIVVQYDGDGQHIAKHIEKLVKAIEEGYDYSIGSRYITDEEGFKSTKLRRFGIWLLSLEIRILSGNRVHDVTSGFRACNKDLIKAFCKYYPKDYPEPEVLGALTKQGYKIKEVSVEMRERQGGVSSIKPLKSMYYMIKVGFSILVKSNSYAKDKIK